MDFVAGMIFGIAMFSVLLCVIYGLVHRPRQWRKPGGAGGGGGQAFFVARGDGILGGGGGGTYDRS